MADIVKLKDWKKAKAKSDKESAAANNRAAFGRTKVEKDSEKAAKAKSDRLLDAHKIDRDDKPE
ncbi:DUF4169 family protein [Magnetospirillum moscoviense]|uniref:Uncharacterized protein n=1 Tax=Magnetospirillum moscoviense TaxID=1437059 RepID=A0A178MUW4_9PROT|nr:DUF4169 family protein [Magnetospirillum moscoviense]MBF0324968.1 DUF4169 family protein [Alphaproteobacteria bacterium]OAN52806.1 hypothetical protein A6A05_10555 [Magnetospirillum moscoviense]